MIQWSRELLEDLIAPEITSFTEADIPDLSDAHAEAKHWIGNHFLNSVFRGRFPPGSKAIVLNLLYRAQTAFRLYNEARKHTLHFLAQREAYNPSSALYFTAVATWETTVLNVQMAQDIFSKLTRTPVFERHTGSDDERLWAIANRIKHCASDISDGKHSTDLTVPMWLANRGLVTRVAELTYAEMGEHVDSLARIAKTLQDPVAAAEKHGTKSSTCK